MRELEGPGVRVDDHEMSVGPCCRLAERAGVVERALCHDFKDCAARFRLCSEVLAIWRREDEVEDIMTGGRELMSDLRSI